MIALGSAGSVTTQVLCPATVALTNGLLCTALAATNTISGAGNQPANVSEWSGAVGFMYAIPVATGEVYFRTDTLYLGERYIDNFEYNEIDSSWRVNTRIGGDITENFRLEGYVENLFKDDTFGPAGNTGIAFGGGNTGRKVFGILPVKREWGVRLLAGPLAALVGAPLLPMMWKAARNMAPTRSARNMPAFAIWCSGWVSSLNGAPISMHLSASRWAISWFARKIGPSLRSTSLLVPNVNCCPRN